MIWYELKDYRKSKEEESMKGRKLKQCNLWATSEDRQSLQNKAMKKTAILLDQYFVS